MNSFSDCESSSSCNTDNRKIKRKGRSNSLRERLSRALTPTRSRSFRITTRVRNSIDSNGNSESSDNNEFSWQTILLSSRANGYSDHHHGDSRAAARLKKCNHVAASAGGTVWYADIRMKYSPQQQQQQQKERKSESDMSSVNATPSRAASALQRSASAASAAASQSTSAARRALTCRPLSTDMFAWMRVFRLATMLHQVGC